MTDPTARRPWFRHLDFRLSVRGLIFLVLVVASVLGWVTRGARAQRSAVATIEREGGGVVYDEPSRSSRYATCRFGPKERPKPEWLVDLVGIDYFGTVNWVFSGRRPGPMDDEMAAIGQLGDVNSLTLRRPLTIYDTDLSLLRGIPGLRVLDISCPAHIRGSALAHLSTLTQLEELRLSVIDLTDTDLAHLSKLTRLELLDLQFDGGTSITEVGMANLATLDKLETLILRGGKGSDLKFLTPLTNLHDLFLIDMPIDDAGLAPLAALRSLEQVGLQDTPAITDSGLASLIKLEKLKSIRMWRTGMTAQGVKAANAVKPNLSIELN